MAVGFDGKLLFALVVALYLSSFDYDRLFCTADGVFRNVVVFEDAHVGDDGILFAVCCHHGDLVHHRLVYVVDVYLFAFDEYLARGSGDCAEDGLHGLADACAFQPRHTYDFATADGEIHVTEALS